jgi:hypothetical protein
VRPLRCSLATIRLPSTDATSFASFFSAGKYTLVVSTFEPDQEGDFELDVQSTTPLHLTPIPQEGNGLRSRTCIGSWSISLSSSLIRSAQSFSLTLSALRVNRNSTTSFGSPTFGHYWRNPTYTLHLPKDSRVLYVSVLSKVSTVPPSLTARFCALFGFKPARVLHSQDILKRRSAHRTQHHPLPPHPLRRPANRSPLVRSLLGRPLRCRHPPPTSRKRDVQSRLVDFLACCRGPVRRSGVLRWGF